MNTRPALTQEILSKIGPNAENRITGPVLRDILIKVVDGTQLNYKGIALPDTVPDASYEDTYSPVFVASTTGTYTHFLGVDDGGSAGPQPIELYGELAILRLTETGWIKDTLILLDDIEFLDLTSAVEFCLDKAVEAEASKIASETATSQALEYKNEAQQANELALEAKQAAENASTTAGEHASNANQSKLDAEAFTTQAEEYSEQALQSRNEAETFRNESKNIVFAAEATGDYTLTADDAGKYIPVNSELPFEVIIPLATFAQGNAVTIEQAGEGEGTITATDGFTLTGKNKTNGQYTTVQIVFKSSDTANITGGI